MQLVKRTWPSAFYTLIPSADTKLNEYPSADNTKEVLLPSWDSKVAGRIVVVAATIACEYALANYVLCFAPLEIYIMSRAFVLPISILISKLMC
jgi:hypothetical protein